MKSLIQGFKTYHKYINHELQSHGGIDLYDYYLKLTFTHHNDKNLLHEFFNEVIITLLEECDSYDIPLYGMILKSKTENLHEVFGLNEIGDKVLRDSRIHADRLLCIMIGYMKSKDILTGARSMLVNKPNYPLFEMMLLIVDGHEVEFVNKFMESISSIEGFCENNFDSEFDTANYIASFQMIMFSAAIFHNRQQILKIIADNQTFNDKDFVLPKRLEHQKSLNNAALNILTCRSSILTINKKVPESLINFEVLKKFLDSRIERTKDRDHIIIDTKFLNGVNCGNWCDNIESLEFIHDSAELREHLTHPTISTYIDVKFNMYKGIFSANLFWYLVLTIIQFWTVYNLVAFYRDNPGVVDDKFDLRSTIVVSLMILRKFLQVCMIGRKELYQQWKNKLESCLIFTMLMTISLKATVAMNVMLHISCFNLFTMVTLLTLTIHYDRMYYYMIWFYSLVFKFLKYFIVFTIVSLALISVFVMVFFPLHIDNKSKDTSNSTTQNATKVMTTFVDAVDLFTGKTELNFTHDLGIIQPIIPHIFYIYAFIVVNVIIGLTANVANDLQASAQQATLNEKFQKFLHTNKVHARFNELEER